MQIIKIDGCTRTIGESQGYIGLPLRDVTLNDSVTGPNSPAMQSAWLPTPEELAAIVAGAPIILTVMGKGHPPVMLATEPTEGAPHTPTAEPYLVWSNEHHAWWGPNKSGYFYRIASAGRYTREDAVAISRGARGGRAFNENPSEVPIALTDALAFWPDDGLEEQQQRTRERIQREIEAAEGDI